MFTIEITYGVIDICVKKKSEERKKGIKQKYLKRSVSV